MTGRTTTRAFFNRAPRARMVACHGHPPRGREAQLETTAGARRAKKAVMLCRQGRNKP